MSNVEDLFAQIAQDEGGPARVRGGPMLVPHGAPPGVRARYTRASSFADRVKDKEHIWTWERRYIARGLGARPDLAELASGETYRSQKLVELEHADSKPAERSQALRENKASGARLDEIVERAKDAAGIAQQADRGTAVHQWLSRGPAAAKEAPEALRGYLDGAWSTLRRLGLVVVASELFVANDEVMAAGTFDVLLYDLVHDRYILADWKTGDRDPGFVIQQSIYANADLYDTDTDERAPFESLTGGQVVERDVALILDVKVEGTAVYEIDIAKGWELTKMIHAISSDLTMDLYEKVPELLEGGNSLLTLIQRAPTLDILTKLWEQTSPEWTNDHRAAAKARGEELS